MAATITLKKIYTKLAHINDELSTLRSYLLPEARLSRKEMAELRRIEREMRSGKETKLEDVLNI